MDSGKTDNERELTSTMGNVLSVSIKDEKNDTSGSDATPTSSTDANTSTTSSRIVSDDPISSTSSDVVELNKSKNLEVSIQSSTEISETTMDEPDKSSVDPETDLLEMSISSVSRERITEDVEDLVHDLESLLGESTDSFNIPIKRREDQKSPTAKESAKTSPNPSDRGDILSPDDNASDKNVQSAQDEEGKEDITIETSNLNLQEKTDAIEEKSKDEDVICNINETETKEETDENESSESEKPIPTETSSGHEAALVSENVIEEISHDIKSNESEIVCETDNQEISELVEDVITNEVSLVQEELEDKIKDVTVEKDVDPNEQPENEGVIEQSTDEAVMEKIDVDRIRTSECKPSEQLQDEEDSASQECKPGQDKEESENITVEKEVEQSEVILVASSSDSTIEEDGPEKTEEAGICQEESISRDIKTDIVESGDNEGEEPQSSTTKELEASLVGDNNPCIEVDAQNEKEQELVSENIFIPQEMEEVSSEKEINVKTEIVEDSTATQLISESSDHDQAEERESVAQADEVDAVETNVPEEVPPKIIAQVPEELESEEVDENFELVLREETESQPPDIPSEKEEVTEVFVLQETENQPEEGHSTRETEVEISEVADTDINTECKIEDASGRTVTPDSGAPEVLKEFEASEVQESQENIPKTLNEETDLEDTSAVIQEAVDNAETKESVVLPTEDSVEPPVETEPVIESTSCTEISTDVTETTVIEESNSESNKIEAIQSNDDKSEAETIIEPTVPTETSELVSDGVLTASNSSSTKIEVSDNDDRQTPSPVEIPEILVPEVEEIDSDKNEVVETVTVEKCEESIPEQVPEISEDVEKETQPFIEELDDDVSSPPQKVFLGFEGIEDVEISVVKPDELGERSDDLVDSNYVVTEPIEQEIPQETEESDEITKFSITFSEITNEIVETGDTGLEDGPEVSELEEISTEDSQQENVLHWVEDLAPIENEEAGSSSEGIDKKLVEIMDEDSKIMEPETESVTFFTTAADSDSEDTVPTLVLEPDEVLPSPEPLGSERINEPALIVDSTDDVPDKLPEIEEILNDEGNVDDVVENIDMQENLETILAVASLQDVPEPVVESQMSDKERREMEALRMAVESITDTSDTVVYADVEPISELVASVEQSIDQIPSGTDVIDTLIVESKPSTEDVEESKAPKDEIDSEEKQVQSSVEVNDIVRCVNKPELVEQNHLKEEGTLPDTSEDKISASGVIRDIVGVLPDSSQGILVCDEVKSAEGAKEKEGKAKANERAKRHKKSTADNRFEELSINVDVPEREKPYSPKVTIKPIKVPDEEVSTTSNSDSEFVKGGLKMTITKQFDKMHSVLKICDSDSSDAVQEQDEPIPKLIIKPKMQQVEQQHSPKMSTRSSKQMYSPTSSSQRSGSPRITIKPVVKPDKVESVTPLKIKIKPEEGSKRHSPKLNIKPVTKPEEDGRENIQSPRKVTIKPIKTPEELEQIQSPRITIKHIPKPDLDKEGVSVTPRLSIKPIKRDDEELEADRERSSPKITIKPVKPPEAEVQVVEPDDAVKERIVLKINKGNLPQTPTKDSKKREHPPDDEKSEKLAKITVKFSKGGGHPHIVHQSEDTNKRPHEEQSPEKMKKAKVDNDSASFTRSKHKDSSEMDPSKMKQKEVDTHLVETRSKHTHLTGDSPMEAKRVKLKDTPESSKQRDSVNEAQRTKSNNDFGDDIRIIEAKLDSPIVISEDSRSQDSGSCVIVEDRKEPLVSTPLHEVASPDTPQAVPIKQDSVGCTPTAPVTPTPRKRGRPRKVPIVVREDFKEQEEPKKEEPPQLLHESGRPKRSCRGQSVRATLGIKPRKPRGPGRGRGGKRGMGTRVVPMKPEGEPKLSKAKLKLIQEGLKVELLRTDEFVERDRKAPEVVQVLEENIKPPAPVPAQQREAPPLTSETPCLPSVLLPEPSPQNLLSSPASLPGTSLKPDSSLLTVEITDSIPVPPATPSTSRAESAEIVMVDEETRMSADTNSRAHTPAKQVVPADGVIEESQSSVQSTGTTESGKATSSRPNKAPRLEVQEPEGAVISADQLTEYYWNGNGPFMLQEQVAQFLGIKSFKRKYPGIMRRMLEIQERDFIRESGLASEHMCDLGLTAVNSADILDIMYSDFQEKYEEYCKHQRDRQAKDLINKQKALSLAASQDKNKADITEQAVQSAAQWNASFNKARKDHRKACMDLQTLTVHYPKGKMKQINKPKVGNYPVALVPGQFTDYYKEFTPTEINNLPLNTMLYNEINIVPPEESEESGTDGSESDSDSSSSSSGSCSSSSGVEDCKLCKHTPKKGSSK